MIQIKLALKRISVVVASLLLVSAFPASALADSGSDPSQGSDSSSTTSSTGPDQPNGVDGNTFTYNPDTGLWENAYYTWDPSTQQTTPKTTQTYSYNPATGHWDTTEWIYNAPSGKYIANVVEVNTPPAGAATTGNPPAPTISDTGPNSNNTTNNTSNADDTFNNFFNAKISNSLSSIAVSGDANVTGNTTAGDAQSGDANDIANILNLLQSSGGVLQGGNLATFTYNVNGNVTGDLSLDPSSIQMTGPNSNNAANNNQNTKITINQQANGEIDNDVNLSANSGNSNISGNNSAGSAKTGDANAEANLVNIIGSIIGANKGFLGVVNINGNLNGDILLPQGTLDSLIAATGPNSNNTTNNNNNSTVNSTNATNQTVNNKIDAASQSGNANDSGNTNGGSATTGNSSNKITLLNLTGKSVIGKDALLVFVNVQGKWVGMIVNAPAGSTAAALGGGITQTGPNSNNTISNNNNATFNDTETANQTINNNLKLRSNSGDASVTGNTNAGDATTGDATTSVNILNIEGSNINLDDWLGILFINVFGTWDGSFGVNTAAGGAGGMGAGPSTAASDAVKVFSMSTGTNGNLHLSPVNSSVVSGLGDGDATNTNQQNTVLAASTNKPKGPQQMSAQSGTFPVLLMTIGLVGFGWLIGSTPQARRNLKNFSLPVWRTVQTASTRLFTFLF